MGALLLTVRDRLKTALHLSDDECEVMPDGQPIPSCGQRFVAVHEGDWNILGPGTGSDYDLDETMGVSVTVTWRIHQYPFDRLGPELLYRPGEGADNFIRRIIAAVHHNQTGIRIAANTRIANEWGSTPDGFCTTLTAGSAGRWEWKTDDWFMAETDVDTPWRFAGIARTIAFIGAQRIQTISGMK